MSIPLDTAPPFGGAGLPLFPCTVSRLIDEVRGKLPSKKFKHLKSAVRIASKKLGRDPTTWIVSSAQELVDAVDGLHPLQHDIKPSYLRVTRSRVKSVLRLSGVEFLNDRRRTEIPDEWAQLLALARLLDERRTRCLSPFIRSLVRAGRLPHETEQADFLTYCREVDETSNRKNKFRSKQAARTCWNYFARRIAPWPSIQLVLPSGRDDYMLPEDQMPTAVRDFDSRATVPLRGNRKYAKRRRKLSAEHIKHRKYMFRRIVSAAVASGIPIERLNTITDVCDPEVLEAAYNFILNRVERKRGSNLDTTDDVSRHSGFMYAIAEQWVGLTGDALATQLQVREDFRYIQQGMAEKNQRVIAKFSSDNAIAHFLRTPARVIAEFNDDPNPNKHACVEIQLAAAMALLTRVLVRMENLKQIVDGVHLVEHGWRDDRKVLLIFGSDEVKNTEYLETLLSPRVVAILDAYKQRAWPKLRRGNSKFLFPGYGDRHKSASCFSKQIADFVLRHTGVRVTPHQFRHLCGYFHLRRHPGDYATVQKMLGHRRIETTIRFYTGTMERKAAFEKYDAGIDERLDGAEQNAHSNAKLRAG